MGFAPLTLRIEHLLRDYAPQVLAIVLRKFQDFAACEDAVQEALIAAALQWPGAGIPDHPRAWLVQVAMRRMTDHLRSEYARHSREQQNADDVAIVLAPEIHQEPALDPDDTLVLLFMCCHPSITTASAIALTLRAVGGLTTAEIAKAFLVPEATMAQRISRAKQSIKAARVAFDAPDAAERAARLGAVMHVLYLMFNEGYVSSHGDQLLRTDLSVEAIRLTRLLHQLLPGHAEVMGLLALMLLTDARRAARSDGRGDLIPLDQQDRRQWNTALIDEGAGLVSTALKKGEVGVYQLQAAIAALHDEAEDVERTDWAQILALYSVLLRIDDNPVVRLNHAVAAAMVHGPTAGLELLEPLQQDERIRDHHRLDAVRAHLLERSGDCATAILLYRSAAQKTSSTPERDFLIRSAARLEQAHQQKAGSI
jgi:RNA polymerase sigma factor (sigma-70 family)